MIVSRAGSQADDWLLGLLCWHLILGTFGACGLTVACGVAEVRELVEPVDQLTAEASGKARTLKSYARVIPPSVCSS